MDPEEQIRELQNLLKKSEEEKQAAQQQLQLAVVEKAKIENEALKRKSSDAYRTPERSVVRSDSGDFSNPSSKKSKVQYGLGKFWGTPESQASASPVTLSQDSRLRDRKQKSQSLIDLEQLRKDGEEMLKAVVLDNPEENLEADAVEDAKEFFKRKGSLGGRPSKKKGSCNAKKVELNALEKLAIVKYWQKVQKESSSQIEAMKVMRRKYKMSTERLKDIFNNEAQWKKLVEQCKLGKEGGSRRGEKARKTRSARGFRRKGAGRKREFEPEIAKLESWLKTERSHGHFVRKAFICKKFQEILVDSAQKMLEEVLSSTDSLRKSMLRVQAKHMMKKVELLKKSSKAAETYTQRLLQYIGAKHQQKELTTNLSELEEKIRIQLSWMSIDYQMWLAGSAPLEVLEAEGVLDPKHVIACRSLGPPPICFADQIPLWAKYSGKKFVFHKDEFCGSSTSDRQQFDLFRGDLLKAAEHFKALEDKQQLVSAEGSSRPEGSKVIAGSKTVKGFSEDEKYRITFEARQMISWLKDEEAPGGFRPVGSLLAPLLVFPGAHARLDNINSDHRFIKTEEFEVNGLSVRHVQGEKTRLMWNLVELRTLQPELFENLEVMQQPSSNVDSVILCWCIQQQALKQPYSVWNRDSFSAIFSPPVLQCQGLASQFSAVLLGKTTAKIQLTDTDFAAVFKADFRKCMQDIEYEAGSEHKVGFKEILKACQAASAKAHTRNRDTQWVLKGAVRNGLLVYVPTVEEGLVQLLSSELQMGSHRIASDVFLPRLSWLLEHGEPKKPDFDVYKVGAKLQDFIEWGYKNPVADEPSDQVDMSLALQDELELPLQNALYLRIDPHLRCVIEKAKLDMTFQQLMEKAAEVRDKRKDKELQRFALRKFTVKQLQEKLQKMSKMEAMDAVKVSVTTKKRVQKKGVLVHPSKKSWATH